MVILLYLMFFFSGAAALIYETGWVRSLSLVFGGSHLAVTTVLAVFMAGLALGSHLLGRYADRVRSPLKLYAALEAGIGASALIFLGLVRAYPFFYGPLARLAPENPIYLSAIRILFATLAMIVPATLMGGTLPVLSRLLASRTGSLGRHLSLLYGINTLGAVAGAILAGFYLLPTHGVTTSLMLAIAVNISIGCLGVMLPDRTAGNTSPTPDPRPPEADRADPRADEPEGWSAVQERSFRLVLWGIGVSGFCALGYEVLWTRILSMVVGTSAYSFTIMLVAFLSGIAMGSALQGLIARRVVAGSRGLRLGIVTFGLIQIAIGAVALLVTVAIRNLPANAIRMQTLMLGMRASEFEIRQGASLFLAFAYMVPAAILMGAAFPLAGGILAGRARAVGRTVGSVLAYNTLGAILGAVSSGFILIYALGIERALQCLAIVNLGIGLWIIASLVSRPRRLHWLSPALAGVGCLLLAVSPGRARIWDEKYLAIYRNNQREVFGTPEKVQDALANTDVVYYHEGINETISVIQPKGANRALIVNGRVEASSSSKDIQCQRTLGHLPMLLHKHPRRVFVLGLGTGMTLGATSIHPEVESITLAEIERGVLPAARAFGEFNHNVLDNPKLRIVFNDGRNFLWTTQEKFDVITADPIHPWSGGAAYLYTTEYFRTVSEHLLPGGLACQWLPIYELSAEDLKTIVRTFTANFPHTRLWLTQYDAELLGSNDPILIDEAELERRIAYPAVSSDLESIEMGSATDFLSYFVMGTQGLEAYGGSSVVNTDDNVHLEFTAPASMGIASLMGENVASLGAERESILFYLSPASDEPAREAQRQRWTRLLAAGETYDRAHALYLAGSSETDRFRELMADLSHAAPGYAPGRFLAHEHAQALASAPRLLLAKSFALQNPGGAARRLEISAVGIRIGEGRGVVMIVDNDAREIYGQRYMDGSGPELDRRMQAFAREVIGDLESAYRQSSTAARSTSAGLPPVEATIRTFKDRVRSGTEGFP